MKTLVLSKLTYLFINLPDPSEEFIKLLEKELFTFLWDGKKGKIKKSVVCKQYADGGLKMINVRSFISTLKLSWLRRLIPDSDWKAFTVNMYPEMGNIENFGAEYIDIIMKNVKNLFWKDVFKHMKNLFKKCIPNTAHEFLAEHIQYNTSILRDKKTIYVKEWHDYNIFLIRQLLNLDGKFFTFNEFLIKYPGIRTNFLLYEGIINAIKGYQHRLNIILTREYSLINNIVWQCIKKGNKYIQQILNYNLDTPAATSRWNTCFENLNWKEIFLHCYKTSGDVQLRWFQTRLLHRVLPTQRYLFLCKIKDSPLCNFCEKDEQSIVHLFFDCDLVSKFWNDLLVLLKEKCNHCHDIYFDQELILFGLKLNVHTDAVLDLIILMAKFYIYKCKLQDTQPILNTFTLLLQNRYNIERYIAAVNDKTSQFDTTWAPYLPIIL